MTDVAMLLADKDAEIERLRALLISSVLPILDKPHTFMDFHFKTVAAEIRRALEP